MRITIVLLQLTSYSWEVAVALVSYFHTNMLAVLLREIISLKFRNDRSKHQACQL